MRGDHYLVEACTSLHVCAVVGPYRRDSIEGRGRRTFQGGWLVVFCVKARAGHHVHCVYSILHLAPLCTIIHSGSGVTVLLQTRPLKWSWRCRTPRLPTRTMPKVDSLLIATLSVLNRVSATVIAVSAALDAVESEELKQPAAGAAVYGPPRPPSKQHPLADVTATAAPEPVAAEPHDMEVDGG